MNTNNKNITDEKALMDYLANHPEKPSGIDKIAIRADLNGLDNKEADPDCSEGSTCKTKLRQEQTSVPRPKRVHVREMECIKDSQGRYRATNGGLYEIVVHPTEDDDEKSVSVVSSSHIAGTVEDLRLLRNLINDLEGHVFPIHHEHDRLAFWRWKAAVIQGILEHPAMQPDREPIVVPHFDGLQWEEDFLSGMTIEQALEKADQQFNRGGW